MLHTRLAVVDMILERRRLTGASFCLTACALRAIIEREF
jgi:hypothetical protein